MTDFGPPPANRKRINEWSTRLRKVRPLTRDEAAVLVGARTLRIRLGVFREAYTLEEVNLLLKARWLALKVGQVRLARFLILRKRGVSLSVPIVAGKQHACPSCGQRHIATMAKLTKRQRAEEWVTVRTAYEKARRRRR